MQGYPLAKEAARCQTMLDGAEMLDGVERTGTAARRMKQIGDDDVVLRGGGLHKAPRIRRHDVRGLSRSRCGGLGHKEFGSFNHFRQQFNRVHIEPAGLGGNVRGSTGAKAQEKRVLWLRMRQKRQQREARFERAARATALLCAVVDAQVFYAARIGRDAGGAHDAIAKPFQAAVGFDIDEAQWRQERPNQSDACQHTSRRKPVALYAPDGQTSIRDEERQPKLGRPKLRKKQNSDERRGTGRCQGVDGDGFAEREPRLLCVAACRAEQRAHHQRRRQHRCQRGQAFAEQCRCGATTP